jgi:Fe(3+) dicitrate transport protein
MKEFACRIALRAVVVVSFLASTAWAEQSPAPELLDSTTAEASAVPSPSVTSANSAPKAPEPKLAAPAEPATAEPATAEPATSPTATSETASGAKPPRRIEEVRIVGKKLDAARIAGSVTVIEQAVLDRFEYDDIHAIFRMVPGVYLREEDGYGLRPNIGIRGVNAERSSKITLMEDAVLFGPAPYSAPAAYYFPLITRMVAVEVFKGPSAVRYGPQTIGGAVNFVSRPIPVEPTIALDGAYGSYGYGKFHGWAGGTWENLGLLVEGVHLESSGFKELDGGGNTGFERNEVVVKGEAGFDLGSDFYLMNSIKIGYSDEGSNETYLGISDEDFAETPYRRYAASQLARMEWHRQQYQFSQVLSWEDQLDFRLTGYRHDFKRKWKKLNSFTPGAPSLRDIFSNPTGRNAVYLEVLKGAQDTSNRLERLRIGTNDREFVSQGIQLQADWRFETGPLSHALNGGVRLHDDRIHRDHTEEPYEMIEGKLEPLDGPPIQIVDSIGKATAWALYLEDEIEWERLIVTAGVRVELIDTRFEEVDEAGPPASKNSQNVVIPGIGAVYFLSDHWSILAGVHRGFSPVAPGQSETVVPEKSINYEFGGRYVAEQTSAQVVGFWNDYDNLLASCRQVTGCNPNEVDDQFNGGGVDVIGVEVDLSHDFETPWNFEIPISLVYTYTHSEFESTFSSASQIFGDVEAGDELPYVPPHLLTANIGLLSDEWDLTLSLRYVDRMRDVAGQGPIPTNERIDSAFVADLAVGWSPVEWVRIYVTTANLLGEEYMVSRRPFGARPGLPRAIQGGIKIFL